MGTREYNPTENEFTPLGIVKDEPGNDLVKTWNETLERHASFSRELNEDGKSDKDKVLLRNLIIESEKTLIQLVKVSNSDNATPNSISIEYLKDLRVDRAMELGKATNEKDKEFLRRSYETLEHGINEISVYRLEQEKSTESEKQKSEATSDVADKNLKAANKNIYAAQLSADPITLDKNELVAYELIKKTGLLTDEGRKAFEEKITNGDEQAKKDALALEKAIAKAGYQTFTVDGEITDKTVFAAKTLIGENTVAINNYEQTLKTLASSLLSVAPDEIKVTVHRGERNLTLASSDSEVNSTLQGEAKELYDAYKGFMQNDGLMIVEEMDELIKLDDKKPNATIQVNADGAVITDANGNSTKITR